nr:hypothetical protein [Permianibacter fluminis]
MSVLIEVTTGLTSSTKGVKSGKLIPARAAKPNKSKAATAADFSNVRILCSHLWFVKTEKQNSCWRGDLRQSNCRQIESGSNSRSTTARLPAQIGYCDHADRLLFHAVVAQESCAGKQVFQRSPGGDAAAERALSEHGESSTSRRSKVSTGCRVNLLKRWRTNQNEATNTSAVSSTCTLSGRDAAAANATVRSITSSGTPYNHNAARCSSCGCIPTTTTSPQATTQSSDVATDSVAVELVLALNNWAPQPFPAAQRGQSARCSGRSCI